MDNEQLHQNNSSQKPYGEKDISNPKLICIIGVFIMCMLSFFIGMFFESYYSTQKQGSSTNGDSVNLKSTHSPVQSSISENLDDKKPKNDYSFNFSMAYTLGESGLYQQAVNYYEKALLLKPNDTLALHNLGINLLHAGRVNESIARFRKALQYNPKDFKTLRHLGYAFAESCQYESAITFYTKALKIEPDDPQTHKWMGFACLDADKIDTAINHFKKVLEYTPDDPFTYDSLGFANFILGNKEKAIEYCQKAIKLDPNNLILKMNFSEIALMTDQWDLALEMTKKSLNEEGLPSAHHLAMRIIKTISLVCKNKRQEAADEAKTILTVYPIIKSFDDSLWNYKGIKNYVKNSKNLNETDKGFFKSLIAKVQPLNILDIKSKSKSLSPNDILPKRSGEIN